MKKHFTLLLCSMLVVSAGCKKAQQLKDAIKEKVLAAYFKDIDALTVGLKDDKAFVVDFGTSDLKTNKDVFSPTVPYFKNISRTGPDTWDAEKIKGIYDELGKLKDIAYEDATIKIGDDDKITVTSAGEGSKKWTAEGSSYTPPTNPYGPGDEDDDDDDEPVNITCNAAEQETKEGNNLTMKDYWRGVPEFKDVAFKSAEYKPLYSNPTTRCHYRLFGETKTIGGNTVRILIYLSHKPTKSQDFTLFESEYASISTFEENTAYIEFEYYWYGLAGQKVNVAVSGSTITATVNNLELHSRQSTWNGTPFFLTFKVTGK